MKSKINIAIIGTGDISKKLADALCGCESVELAAVYSRTKEKAEAFASEFNISEIFTNLEELARSPFIDAVYIASPNSCHYQHSMLMMQNRKHVLCEKPIATCADEFLKMLKAAEDNNVVLLEATRFYHAPGLKKLKELLSKISPVRRASLLFNQYSSKYDALKNGETPNIFNKEFAGGALMDLGVYCVELMVALFGEPNEVISSHILLNTGVDGQGAVIAKYDGFLAELSYSKISHAATPCVIQGEKGSLLFIKASIIDKIDVIMRNGETEQLICYTDENDMIFELQAFAEIINEPQKAEQYNNYTMEAQKIMDEIKQQMI